MIFPLVGNENIKEVIINAINNKRIPHALIIEGDSGTGKSALAQYISAAAVCGGLPTDDNDRNVRLALAGTHPDIYIAAPEEKRKNISVDKIRAMRSEAYIKPRTADCRVFIIDKAETMNVASQNAILKVLEEPPGNVYFILITLSSFDLLPTIRSRAVCLSLTAPDTKTAVNYLLSNSKADKETVLSAVNIAKGNIGRAEILLGKRKAKKTDNAAAEYVNELLYGTEYGMVKICFALEKDRNATADFYKELKYIFMSKARENTDNSALLKKFVKMCDTVCELEKQLDTNANLPLLFAVTAGKLRSIV